MGIVPGDDPGHREEPLLADEPLPPGVQDYSGDVDAIERRIRQRGPDEVRRADEKADAVEDEDGAEPGAASDAGRDPTSDEGADPEDPQAQRGGTPATGSGD